MFPSVRANPHIEIGRENDPPRVSLFTVNSSEHAALVNGAHKMRRTRIEHMSAGPPQIADIARRGWHGRKVPTAVFAAVRRTDVTEYVVGIAASLRLDASKLDYLGPLLGFVRD